MVVEVLYIRIPLLPWPQRVNGSGKPENITLPSARDRVLIMNTTTSPDAPTLFTNGGTTTPPMFQRNITGKKLDIGIIGAGIGGLGAAIALRREGHRVEVLSRGQRNSLT